MARGRIGFGRERNSNPDAALAHPTALIFPARHPANVSDAKQT